MKGKMQRRNFLKQSLAAGSGIAFTAAPEALSCPRFIEEDTEMTRLGAIALVFLLGLGSAGAQNNPQVVLKTNFGEIVLELYPDKAPQSVKNFLTYVDEGFYTDTAFHRVIDGFMI